jgi:RNA-directed DNA polymerase
VRRVMIPKPGGNGERPLGIPTIRDRTVQAAAKLVLEPIFEADLDPSAFGYRPKRSGHDAIKEVHTLICRGYTDVVDADLSKYFDTIQHRELMQSVARRIVDRNVLRLIKMWLKAPIEERGDDGKRRMSGGRRSTCGTPQGGVFSPTLANVYMNRFLKYWRRSERSSAYQAHVVSYADDFVILSRGHAEEALAWTWQAMARLGLTLNEAKTSVRDARRERFDFLGYAFGPHHYRKDGHWYLGASPSKKSVRRLKQKVGEILVPGNQAPWPEVRDRLNRLLRGWSAYFSYGTRLVAYRAVDNHVYHSVRRFLVRRHKVQSQGTRRFSASVRRTRRASTTPRSYWLAADSCEVKPVGKPDAGNRHVRFDERRPETERGSVQDRWQPRQSSTLQRVRVRAVNPAISGHFSGVHLRVRWLLNEVRGMRE